MGDGQQQLPEGATVEPIVREALQPKAQAAAGSKALPEGAKIVPIQRVQASTSSDASSDSGHPENYGFTWGNMAHNVKEHLAGLGTGILRTGQDVLTNPDWIVGQGNTLNEKLNDPNTTFSHLVGTPARQEEAKAREASKAGHNVEAAGHELASYIPIIGPWAASLGEQAGTGDIGGALAGGLTDVAAAKAVPKVAGKVVSEAGEIPKVWRGLKTIGENASRVPPTTVPNVGARPAAVAPAPVPQEMPYVAQGPPVPPPTVRRVPGDIAPERVSSGAEPRMPTVQGPGNQVLAGGGGQIVRPQMALPPAPEPAPAELPTVKPKSFNWNMNKLRDLVESEGAGTPPPLKRNVPLGEQLFRPAAPAPSEFPAVGRPAPRAMAPNELPSVNQPPPAAPPAEMPSAGQKVSDILNQNTEQEAVRPLSAGPQKATPLRQIAEEGPPAEPVTHRATVTHEGKTFGMEAANGRKMYDATAHDTELARDIHLLSTKDATKGPTVQNAFMNLGGDVNQVGLEGQRFKAAVKGPTERVQMFDWLLDHGHTPEEIIAAAKKTPGAK